MKRPFLERLVPETSGFNQRRIAIAAGVLLLTLGAVTYLLTQGPGEPIVRTEPAEPADPRPPRELLEDLPEADPTPPPLLRPQLEPIFGADPSPAPEPPPEPRISPRVVKAFQGISYSRRQRPASPSARPRPHAVRGELGALFEDLERQRLTLGDLLEKASESPSREDLAPKVTRDAPPAAGRKSPPQTRHQLAAIESPPGPFVLRQGTLIPAQLLTEINSDLPGQVLAQITTDVRDSLTFRTLLLPRGTKLVGAYSSGLGAGQNRLAVAWSRMLLPDGGSIDLDQLPAVDAQGRSGLRDRVNHHTGRLFGNALLLSLLSAGFQSAQPSSDALRLSAGELAVQGASRELERAAAQILRRNASIPPTVRIRAGTVFNVFLTGDLTLAGPYRP